MSRGKLKPEEEDSIINNYIFLKEQVEAKDIVDYLFQLGVITKDDKECIVSGISQMERTEKLLTLVLHAGPTNAFTIFLDSLRKKYPHVQETLRRSVREAKEKASRSDTTAQEELEPEKPQKWTKGEILGTGKFGKIYLCSESNSGLTFALKEVQFGSDDEARERMMAMENELDILSKLRHKRILKYYGSRREKDGMSIFLEYMPGGSVSTHMRNHGVYTEKVTAKVTKQVLEGLVFLHNKNIVHRNIKAANILRDTLGNIKIADFGISKYLSNTSVKGTRAPVEETAYWRAPEVIRGEKYNCNADIWSLGCTVVEMMTLSPPFIEHDVETAIFKIGNKEQPEYKLPPSASEDIKTFLLKTFEQDSSKRTSAHNLLEHAFVKI